MDYSVPVEEKDNMFNYSYIAKLSPIEVDDIKSEVSDKNQQHQSVYIRGPSGTGQVPISSHYPIYAPQSYRQLHQYLVYRTSVGSNPAFVQIPSNQFQQYVSLPQNLNIHRTIFGYEYSGAKQEQVYYARQHHADTIDSWFTEFSNFSSDCHSVSKGSLGRADRERSLLTVALPLPELVGANHTNLRLWSFQHLPFMKACSAAPRVVKFRRASCPLLSLTCTSSNSTAESSPYGKKCSFKAATFARPTGKVLTNCLFLSTVVSACGDDIPISASDDIGEDSLTTSDAMLVLSLLADFSVTTSPLGPVACQLLWTYNFGCICLFWVSWLNLGGSSVAQGLCWLNVHVLVLQQDRCRLQRSIAYWFEAAHVITNGSANHKEIEPTAQQALALGKQISNTVLGS
ncbi:hypothetical protein KIW84_064200 [Lathyrus oleraceus]|uniref:Uncharacterized protein n=1 Tax=Pisum sativum TaxID=3888 RepID=A0A9D4WB12_PEA|nr:hypothetical protein KIW84_064200 [Pisum sativum]